MEPATYRELQLLSEVVSTPEITQRQLSQKVGMALGLTNTLLRNLTKKGYIRVAQASWKRRLYTLTPEGFSHRVRLMSTYVHRFLEHYRSVRQTLREQLEPLVLHEESRVAIYGSSEFAEIVYLAIKEFGIEEIDIFGPPNSEGSSFLGMPVRDVATIQPERYDRVLIAVLAEPGATSKVLLERGASPEQLVAFFADGRTREAA